jgi:peptidyl-prolyl cis-trans isomerase SurA
MINKKLLIKSLTLILSVGLISTMLLNGCGKNGFLGFGKKVVADIADDKIYLKEFEDYYLKYVSYDSAKNVPLENRLKTLDAMINLRLKVKDAIDKGYLNNTDVQTDLANFNKNNLPNFIINKEVIEPIVKDVWEKGKYEYRANMIFLMLPQNPSPEDSVKVYQKADTIINRLQKGEDFATISDLYNEDMGLKAKHGDTYYFTLQAAFLPFDDLILGMKVKEIAKQPLRIPNGLIIVQLTDRKKRVGAVRVSRIALEFKRDSLGRIIDSAGVVENARKIWERAKQGEDFAALAKEYSQDAFTMGRGGDMGWLDPRKLGPPTDSTILTLKVGDVSDLVATSNRVEFVKVLGIKDYEPYEIQKNEIKRRFTRDHPTVKSEIEKFMQKLRGKFNFEIDNSALDIVLTLMDTTKMLNDIRLDSVFTGLDMNMPLATFKGGEFLLSEFIDYLKIAKQYSMTTATRANIIQILEEAAQNNLLLALAEKEGIEKDPEYISLYNENKYALLSQKIDMEISSKVVIKDEDLQTYYNNNIANYQVIENGTPRTKTLEEVRSDVTMAVQKQKREAVEKEYLEQLKQKYPVKVYENVVQKAFN